MIEASRMVSGISLQDVSQEFIPKLVSVYYNAANALHLIYDRCIIGELSTLTNCGEDSASRESLFSSIDMRASMQYLASSIAQALWTIHKSGIIYRNISTETILMDSMGKILISDFTLSKIVGDSCHGCKTYTLCGTANYMSPEQLSQVGHDETVDFWALGVCLYDFLTGEYPFAERSEIATYSKITIYAADPSKSPLNYETNNKLHNDASSLISNLLLSVESGKRMTSESAFMSHPFLSDINWKKINEPSPFYNLANEEFNAIMSEGYTGVKCREIEKSFDQPQKPEEQNWAASLASSST